MNRVSVIQTWFVVFCVVACLGLYFPSQQSTRGEDRSQGERRWEYSAVRITEVYGTGKGKTVGVASVCHLKLSGAQCVRVEAELDGTMDKNLETARADSLAKAVSKLGHEGWELVGEAGGPNDGTAKALYFRRQSL